MTEEAIAAIPGHHHEHKRGSGSEASVGRRLLLSAALTGLICLVEVAGGLWTGSLALLSDAAHVFLDVVALAMSYVALRLAALPPNARHSYGYRRAEVLAALINAVTLLIVAMGIGKEAWERWQSPVAVHSGEMLVIAAVGLVANLAVVLTLRGHTHGNLNVRSAFLHVVGDALASVGVIAAAIVMLTTGWYGADPLISVLIGVLIAYNGWGVLREAVHILMEGAPEGMTTIELARSLAGVEGVLAVHDLHAWSTGSGHPMLSAHVRVAEATLPESPALLVRLRRLLKDRYSIDHATLQVECEDCGQGCVECLGSLGDTASPKAGSSMECTPTMWGRKD